MLKIEPGFPETGNDPRYSTPGVIIYCLSKIPWDGRVSSGNIVARCAVGFLYYPSFYEILRWSPASNKNNLYTCKSQLNIWLGVNGVPKSIKQDSQWKCPSPPPAHINYSCPIYYDKPDRDRSPTSRRSDVKQGSTSMKPLLQSKPWMTSNWL